MSIVIAFMAFVVSSVMSFMALAVSAAAFVRTTLPTLTIDNVERVRPGTYRVTVGNVGSGGARHVVVLLYSHDGRRLVSETPPGRTIHKDSSGAFDIVTAAEDADFPLTIKLEWQWLGRKKCKTSSKKIYAERKDQQPVTSDTPGDAGPGPHVPFTNATFDEIWNRLHSFEYPGMISSQRWTEILGIQHRMERPEVGEIHEPSDWHEFPEGVSLRVMAIKSGETITVRWASDDGFEQLGCRKDRPNHQYLLGHDEGPARSGYITRQGQDLTIRG
jgi:hypothetical protein